MDKTQTKTIYAYDADGKYTQTLILNHTDRSQISGAWQIPAQCTEVAPPNETGGFDRVFDGMVWEYQKQPQEEEPELTFTKLQSMKLTEIDEMTRKEITGGFISTAKGAANFYDSAEADQLTFSAMYAASKSPNFETTEPYCGSIPIRAVTPNKGEKEILQHNAAEMQKLIDDLALHIGHCKQIAWQLQEQVKAAVSQNDLDKITWIS